MMNKNYYVLNETIWSCTDDDYNFTIVTEIDEDGNIKKLSVNVCDKYGDYKELEDGEEPDFVNGIPIFDTTAFLISRELENMELSIEINTKKTRLKLFRKI